MLTDDEADAIISEHEAKRPPLAARSVMREAVKTAYRRGYSCGERNAEREHRDIILDAVAEARWQERQGEDYGSY